MADFKLSPDGLYVGANGVVFEDGFSVPGTYHTWRRDYSINNLNPTDLLYRDGSALPTGGAYRFSAHISGTGTDQSATAVYWNQNGTWKLNVVFQSGTSSNHPEFIIGANGNPQISIDHTSYYTINIYHEHMQLAEESTGTDNFGGFGADQYMSYVDGLRFNPSGSGTTWNQGYTVWHAGNDGTGSTLDADLLDGVQGTSYLRSDAADTATGKINFDYAVSNLNSVSGLDGVTPFKAGFQATNRPGSGNYATGFEFVFEDAGARTQFVAASDGDNSVPSLYARTEGWASNDGWHPWYEIWHSGNHGSGSGLDADLLDGLDSSAFLRSDASGTTTGILTTDQVRWGSGAGTYSGNPRSAVIGYSGGNYGQIGYGWIPTTTSNVHTSQINDLQSRVDFYNGIRVFGSGSAVAVGTNVTWTEILDARTNAFTYKGNTIWHAANDGASSGLDADLLDGQHGSYYTSYTDTAIANLVASAPGTLDTLNELAAALGDDPNFATTVTNNIAGKLNLSGGTMTGGLTFGAGVTLTEATDRADLLKITSSTATWAGIQIANTSNEGLWSFMTDGSTGGIYDDMSNAWHIQFIDGGETRLYHAGTEKLNTTTSGVTVTGTAVADTFNATSTTNGGFQGIDADSATNPSFTWSADLNTGIYRPAADTLSVTTAGAQRFTVGPAGQIGVGGANYGTSGQVLTSGGSGAAPSWAEPVAATMSPATATELSSSVDLDSLTTAEAGFYYQTLNADTTGNNYPSNEAGSLLVQRSASGGATQLYQTYSTSPDLYFRSAYNAGYGSWNKVAHSGQSLGEVGTYAWLMRTSSTANVTAGTTVAGSGLFYAGFSAAAWTISTSNHAFDDESGDLGMGPGTSYRVSPSGTWRACGTTAVVSSYGYSSTLWVRIS